MSVEQSGASDQDGFGASGPAPAEAGNTQFATTRTIGPNETTPGMVIGFYRLLQPVGWGGMGEVWLAEQKEPLPRGMRRQRFRRCHRKRTNSAPCLKRRTHRRITRRGTFSMG